MKAQTRPLLCKAILRLYQRVLVPHHKAGDAYWAGLDCAVILQTGVSSSRKGTLWIESR